MKKELFKINLFITVLSVLGFLFIFLCIRTNSLNYIILNIHFSFSVLFLYFYMLLVDLKRKILSYKNEVLYINYPITIALFFILFFIILISSVITLSITNKEANNITATFAFFLSIISIFIPTFILLAIVHFISPALIISNLHSDNKSISKYKNIYLIMLSIFILIIIGNGILSYTEIENPKINNKFKSSKLNIRFSTELLKIDKNVKLYAKKLMSKDNINIPFFYTKYSFSFDNFEKAEEFCKSINAKIPNYLEIFHIAFNYYDIFDDKYYWTSDKDENTPLVLHFKNMSYVIEKLPPNVTPRLYCVMSTEDNLGFQKKEYFYKNIEKKNIKQNKKVVNKINKTEETKKQQKVNSEKKYVNFSVKEVSSQYMYKLIQKGYFYNPEISINSEYEANETKLDNVLERNENNIRLCYYPFIDYGSMDIDKERQIWEQSFCSPSFELLNNKPMYIQNSQKKLYCAKQGGRLPNIPELTAILKVKNEDIEGNLYWTNNKTNDYNTSSYIAIVANYKNSRFLELREIKENKSAYAYCIKDAKTKSKIIANYSSRFKGYDGRELYTKYCSDCYYYEVPDVILNNKF